jgi:hypothetical protein
MVRDSDIQDIHSIDFSRLFRVGSGHLMSSLLLLLGSVEAAARLSLLNADSCRSPPHLLTTIDVQLLNHSVLNVDVRRVRCRNLYLSYCL